MIVYNTKGFQGVLNNWNAHNIAWEETIKIKPKSYCICHLPIDLPPNGIRSKFFNCNKIRTKMDLKSEIVTLSNRDGGGGKIWGKYKLELKSKFLKFENLEGSQNELRKI